MYHDSAFTHISATPAHTNAPHASFREVLIGKCDAHASVEASFTQSLHRRRIKSAVHGVKCFSLACRRVRETETRHGLPLHCRSAQT
jgi:hypothetical protein